MSPASFSSWHSLCCTRLDNHQAGVRSLPKATWYILNVAYLLQSLFLTLIFFTSPFFLTFLAFDSKTNELCLMKNESTTPVPCFAHCLSLIVHDFLSNRRRHWLWSQGCADSPALLMISICLQRVLDPEILLSARTGVIWRGKVRMSHQENGQAGLPMDSCVYHHWQWKMSMLTELLMLWFPSQLCHQLLWPWKIHFPGFSASPSIKRR